MQIEFPGKKEHNYMNLLVTHADQHYGWYSRYELRVIVLIVGVDALFSIMQEVVQGVVGELSHLYFVSRFPDFHTNKCHKDVQGLI